MTLIVMFDCENVFPHMKDFYFVTEVGLPSKFVLRVQTL